MIYLEGAWNPILPLPLINRALTLLESRRSVQVRPDKKYPYALTPRLFCASCGRKLVGQRERTSKGGTRFYRHEHKGDCGASVGQINAKVAEEYAAGLLADLVLPAARWPLLEEALRSIAREDEEIATLEARMEAPERRRQRLKELYAQQYIEETNVMSWEEYRTKLQRYDNEIAALEAKFEQAGAINPATFREIMGRLADLAALIKKASVQTRKELFAGCFDWLYINLALCTFSP